MIGPAESPADIATIGTCDDCHDDIESGDLWQITVPQLGMTPDVIIRGHEECMLAEWRKVVATLTLEQISEGFIPEAMQLEDDALNCGSCGRPGYACGCP
jgi:hypothetical protein